MHLSRRARVLAAVALVGTLGLSACGDDDDEPASSGDENTTTSAAEAPAEDGEAVEVKGVDYAFQGLPKEVPAGTEFTFTNASDKEAHEMVLFKLPEGETRPLEELLALPEEEAGKVTGPPIAVSVAAMPGSEGEMALGESLTVEEPGRYIALCGIPVGADPEKMAEAMEHPEDGPPPAGENDGPPHFTQGMVQEFTVS